MYCQDQKKSCPHAILATGALAPNYLNTSLAMQRAQMIKTGHGMGTFVPRVVPPPEEPAILQHLPIGIFGF